MSISNPFYDKAFLYVNNGKTDSAFFYFDAAKQVFLEMGDSLHVAKCLINMAITQQEKADYFGSQETALQAVPFLDEHKVEHQTFLSMNYNALGLAAYYLKDYSRSITFYESAIKYSDDSTNTIAYSNNLAVSYYESGNFKEALKIYKAIIDGTRNNSTEYARILSNLARAKWKENPTYPAIQELLIALKIREQEKDLWGQNASLTYITEYYADSKPDSALVFAKRRYVMAKKIASPNDQILALTKLIKLSPSDSSKYYFEIYNTLNDSLQQARLAAKNQFTMIRYEVEKNKADNLSLQKDNAEKAYNISRQRMWTAGISIFSLIVIIGGIFWYKRRKERLQLEAQNRIKANQLNISRKIHDVVANGLYRVMTEIENREDIDRDGILDRLEMMYEKSRDISYETEVTKPEQQDYHTQIAELLKSFVTENRKVIIAGNDAEQWERIHADSKEQIHHVLQELMVNMRKHSQATNVVIRFDWDADVLRIYYSDNGIGMSDTQVKGNGLTSTGNRIFNLNGKITFVTQAEKGLKIEISMPIL
ncbi:tetratricopeptide repeat-containing sensor histidine kinase [Sphingobacterium faecium]|uniref:ATP-binding protein n=1 Tax=Sphingobacterium faecium TaxID=34087 RepID=UPI00097F557B|nr:tetratricopeptide repeat-containing sensor histidine kinase [Sphingobacterium faecium]WGQ13829.1 tetratricopeptide repeat protein [Sphingobacterium faecium]SJN45855.1 Sensory box histidine kinase [Sphingobacterium faecium PCAi_F2.5]